MQRKHNIACYTWINQWAFIIIYFIIMLPAAVNCRRTRTVVSFFNKRNYDVALGSMMTSKRIKKCVIFAKKKWASNLVADAQRKNPTWQSTAIRVSQLRTTCTSLNAPYIKMVWAKAVPCDPATRTILVFTYQLVWPTACFLGVLVTQQPN